MSERVRREWATRTGDVNPTVSKMYRSAAFRRSRAEAEILVQDPSALRRLADDVDGIDVRGQPLELVADGIAAAVAFTRDLADRLEADRTAAEAAAATLTGGDLARHRLLVAGLHYLITPVDVIPDFKPGGYVDDAVLLSLVFGMASDDLASFPDEGFAG